MRAPALLLVTLLMLAAFGPSASAASAEETTTQDVIGMTVQPSPWDPARHGRTFSLMNTGTVPMTFATTPMDDWELDLPTTPVQPGEWVTATLIGDGPSTTFLVTGVAADPAAAMVNTSANIKVSLTGYDGLIPKPFLRMIAIALILVALLALSGYAIWWATTNLSLTRKSR